MTFNLKKFESKLPSFFPALLKELEKHALIPTIVGGAVRDFFLKDDLGKDWDVELSSGSLAFNKDLWKALGKDLSQFGKVGFLSYDVIRLELREHSLEFSPPRKENFSTHLSGHRNFTVEFDFKMPFEKAVLRRDFTINSMGVRLAQAGTEFLDPLEGLRHLREGILHPAGADFGKDPVRFLRALRFSKILKFQMSPELESVMKRMSLDFSPTYLWKEMQKSGNALDFYFELLSWRKLNLGLNLPIEDLNREELKKVLKDASRHEAWMVALEWSDTSCEPWQKYFGQSGDTCRRLSRWVQESKQIQKLLPETFHADFEDVNGRPDFELIFNWYFTTKHLLQKYPTLPLLQMIEEHISDWIHLFRFESLKDVKHIDPPLRAKYQVWNLCQRL